jgi:YVTN family beta-propeller protein
MLQKSLLEIPPGRFADRLLRLAALLSALALLAWLAATAGCAGVTSAEPVSDRGAGGGPTGGPGSNGAGSGTIPGTQDPGAADAGVAPPPPETEVRQEFEVPRGGARFVYVANRKRNSVSVIDSTQLTIRSVPVGDTPTALSTAVGQDLALVINSGSKDLNVLRTDAMGVTVTSRVPVVAGANRVSVAPDGKHAVVWFDSAATTGSTPLGGTFQEVSVITLAPAADVAVDLTVGFRPTDVVFSTDSQGAFIVTEDGISVVRFADLKGPSVAPFVRFPDAGAAAAAPLDVSVTPDGRRAIARREGAAQVMLLDLGAVGAGPVQILDLGAPVTDLDLAPSGQFALAVLRSQNAYVRIPVPAGFAAGAALDKHILVGEQVGSAVLSADGMRAVLYTTAGTPPVERLVVVDLAGSAAPLPVTLKKSVRAVAIAPDGKTAIVLHNKVAGDPAEAKIDVETQIDRSYGYTIVNLTSGFPKLQITSADVGALAITPGGGRAFVLLREPRLAQRITLASFIVDEFPLGGPPVALAVLSETVKRVFISQEHPEGRISFIDWESGVVESVTGFELNGRIVQ